MRGLSVIDAVLIHAPLLYKMKRLGVVPLRTLPKLRTFWFLLRAHWRFVLAHSSEEQSGLLEQREISPTSAKPTSRLAQPCVNR